MSFYREAVSTTTEFSSDQFDLIIPKVKAVRNFYTGDRTDTVYTSIAPFSTTDSPGGIADFSLTSVTYTTGHNAILQWSSLPGIIPNLVTPIEGPLPDKLGKAGPVPDSSDGNEVSYSNSHRRVRCSLYETIANYATYTQQVIYTPTSSEPGYLALPSTVESFAIPTASSVKASKSAQY